MENRRHLAFLAALALMVLLVLTGCGGAGQNATATVEGGTQSAIPPSKMPRSAAAPALSPVCLP